MNPALKKKVATHFEQNCPTSPCAKDRMRKWLAVGIFIFAQAMILMTTYTKLFKSFKAEHGDAISESQFHKERPWNIKRACHDSCLCKSCENFKMYEDGSEVSQVHEFSVARATFILIPQSRRMVLWLCRSW